MTEKLLALVLAACVAAPALAQDTKVYGAKEEGVTLPQVVREVHAQYTSEAMSQMIEGEVVLDVVVNSDGTVGDVAVKQSLDRIYGLDESAVKAMKQWEFKPGTKDGKPVNVRVEVRMKFTLK
jgi:TonB family protein